MDGILSFVRGLSGFLFHRHRNARRLPSSRGRRTRALSRKESGHRRPSNHHIDRDQDEDSCMKRPRTIASTAESCNVAGLKRRRIELQQSKRCRLVGSGASVTSRRLDQQKLVGDVLQIDGDRSPSSSVGSCSP
ncbi:hypothetical protein C4D60_Mb08t05410 [Musa balbisiana]|uniref:Uncharacterized protein n=1 Tax=Musa balbisiana TaxID=52838 RepID=A0A4S8K1M3_MUSBA|nr:hypothetical protein C4D60_Mb08t05410 [Musa balbisiana]